MGWYAICNDGVQDMLPQNMTPWHIEHFKLKEFQKWHVQEGLSALPWSTPCERCPPSTQRKGLRGECE